MRLYLFCQFEISKGLLNSCKGVRKAFDQYLGALIKQKQQLKEKEEEITSTQQKAKATHDKLVLDIDQLKGDVDILKKGEKAAN